MSEAESRDYLVDLTRDVQHSQDSRSDYATDFLRSRDVWNGGDLRDRVVRIVDTLRTAARSPGQLPWPVWRPELLDAGL